MNEQQIADFYHGWLIEITSTEAGFQNVCYSPCRQRFIDRNFYDSEQDAMSAARLIINWYTACHSIANWLRDLYEVDAISFEDWQPLRQSLFRLIKTA